MSEPKVPDTFTVTVAGDPRHLKMTFGLLNELVRTVGDIEGVAEISFDTELRNTLLNELFARRDEQGVIVEPVNLFHFDIAPDEVVELMEWVGVHITDFLLKQMIRSKALMEARQPQIEALMPTSTGSPN
ncbi:hypothetical protein MHM88_14355 [Epibacterium sp. MM17-32]|uniref:hypothetical protein n=1 Tax=Epibacterium sp. MM17-32 TaxID=2917734 RepID=UPI001EF51B03|nr:hypothetical protein [Epibacterium sp. MM17-32]MCG7628990.1 hypothetical protein [Epibacterium sp. MM17-32]